jgi:hypothetical protein
MSKINSFINNFGDILKLVIQKFASKKFIVNLTGTGSILGIVPYLPENYQIPAATIIALSQFAYTLIQGAIDGIEKYKNGTLTKENISNIINNLSTEAQNVVDSIPTQIISTPETPAYSSGDVLPKKENIEYKTILTETGPFFYRDGEDGKIKTMLLNASNTNVPMRVPPIDAIESPTQPIN